jgi:hypothetical protein
MRVDQSGNERGTRERNAFCVVACREFFARSHFPYSVALYQDCVPLTPFVAGHPDVVGKQKKETRRVHCQAFGPSGGGAEATPRARRFVNQRLIPRPP